MSTLLVPKVVRSPLGSQQNSLSDSGTANCNTCNNMRSSAHRFGSHAKMRDNLQIALQRHLFQCSSRLVKLFNHLRAIVWHPKATCADCIIHTGLQDGLRSRLARLLQAKHAYTDPVHLGSPSCSGLGRPRSVDTHNRQTSL